jgi:para-nitrobenzyl esterase
LGAAHATEIPFVFDTLDTPDAVALLGPGAPQEVADAMHAAWVRFITAGDPGWAAYNASTRTTQVFGADGTVTQEHPNAERLALWEGVR